MSTTSARTSDHAAERTSATATLELPAIDGGDGDGATPPLGPDVPRPISRRSPDDLLLGIGAAIGSFAAVWLLYERLLPLSGTLGFLICWFVAFLGLLAVLTGMANPRPIVADKVATAVITAGAVVVGIALASAVIYVFVRGHTALMHLNFYTHDASGVAPTAPLTKGGISHAIIGTLIEIAIAIAIALPLGIGTAVFMTETRGPLSRTVRTVVEAMTALPDILAGLFIYTSVVVGLGVGRCGLAAALALAIMMLPVIARSAYVVLQVVPGGLREASLALGASRLQTVWRVVLPTARPGLATAVILGVARGIGETAPVLLTSGATSFFNTDPLRNPMNSLPLYVLTSVRSGEPLSITRGFGACALLLAMVLVLFVVTRLLARQKASR
jgi:phosphate transport system permease protein